MNKVKVVLGLIGIAAWYVIATYWGMLLLGGH